MIISFVNQKGGVGKTTIAINFAGSLARRNRRVVLVDLDPQGSAVKWQGVEENQAFETVHQPFMLRPSDIEVLAGAYDDVIIDAPPDISANTRAALSACNMAVIPVSPSSLDLWACTDTLKMIESVQSRHPDLSVTFLVNRKIPGTRTGREIRDALKAFNFSILEAEVCQRVAFVEAMKYGISVMQFSPGSKAANEIELLCDEILLGHENREQTESGNIDPIAELYQEETDNILFRSFQGL